MEVPDSIPPSGDSACSIECQEKTPLASMGFKVVLSKSKKKRMCQQAKQTARVEKLNPHSRGDLTILPNEDNLLELRRI